MADAPVEVSTQIKADANAIYDMVSDLPRMGEWSPEATGGRWVGGATGPEVGARFRGHNQAGWRRWSTNAEVTAADRGKRFAFRVTYGPLAISQWSYDLEPTGDGVNVTERWEDRRPYWMYQLGKPVMGVYDRPAHNRANMQQTLDRLKRAAEAVGHTAS